MLRLPHLCVAMVTRIQPFGSILRFFASFIRNHCGGNKAAVVGMQCDLRLHSRSSLLLMFAFLFVASFFLFFSVMISGVNGSPAATSSRERSCLERIWPEFQRCRERQRDHFRYGRFSSGFSFSTDAYQPKYRTECCSYWELLECAHRFAKLYCADQVDLKKLDSFVELVGLAVPLYVCSDEYPKGSFRCKLPSWFGVIVFFAIFLFLLLLLTLFICIRRSK